VPSALTHAGPESGRIGLVCFYSISFRQRN